MTEQEVTQVRILAEQFFTLLHVTATVSIEVSDDEALRVDVQGEQLGALIGHHGETLYALQLLLSVLVNRTVGRWVPVSLEIGDWRAQREAWLQDMVQKVTEQVRSSGYPHALPPMYPVERRMVHMYVGEYPEFISESEGEGSDRRVIIKLKSMPS